MKNDTIIIFGSSRANGNTKKVVDILDPQKEFNFVNLSELNISPFDYEHKNKDDDYLSLMEKVIHYKNIILATPVYWYTMSAQMKIFLDRLSDLLIIRKDLGRKLASKNLLVIASFSTSLPNGFTLPFSQTCEYMDMNYVDSFFYYFGKNEELLKNNDKIKDFRKKIDNL